jgi:histidyl-tRNA synthetase
MLATRTLRAAGIGADVDYRGGSVKSQLRRADKVGARFALIVGDDELARGAGALRDLVGKSQREVPLAEVVATVRAAAEVSP